MHEVGQPPLHFCGKASIVKSYRSFNRLLNSRQLPWDWEERYGLTPWLQETLVDPARFEGACYRAANWIEVGVTTDRGRQDRHHRRHGAQPKTVWLYPLWRDARQRLCRMD